MERILGWYRLTSSVGAVVALVVANAIPLLGVLFLGWNVWTILIVYWLENGIVGAFNIAKISKAQGPYEGSTSSMRLNGRSMSDVANARSGLIPFFILHYGIFWAVHGVFVLMLPVFGGIDSTTDMTIGADPLTILFAIVALTISHGVSYVFNFIGRGEYLRVSPAAQMFAPYGRLVVLHVTIIFGAIAIGMTGAPEAALVVLVGLKTLMDVGFHLSEHRTAGVARSV